MTSSSSILTTAHSITLTGLSAATTYHYQIGSQDGSGDLATSSDQTFTTVVQCNYYIDSVSGNDANTGNDASIPLQHLMSVPTAVPDGTTICLKRGDTFLNDSLLINSGSYVTVRDYGPINLPMPLIDNAGYIASSSWSLVPLTSNLYQATVAGPGSAYTSAGTYVEVFECKNAPCIPTGAGGNDNFLQTVNTQALASSTPGSYYILGENTDGSSGPTDLDSFTIYMRPSDGTSPITNGYSYSYSKTSGGILLYGSYPTVSNIAAKKSSGNQGGFYADPASYNATFNNVESDQDGKHNLECAGGCTVNNSKFIDAYYPQAAGLLVVFGYGTSAPVTLNNNIFINGATTAGNAVAAMLSHGVGLFSTITVNGGLVQGISSPSTYSDLSGTSFTDVSNVSINGLTCLNTFGCVNMSGPTTISNVQDYSASSTSDSLNVNYGSNYSVTVASTSVCDNVNFNRAIVADSAVNTQVSIASSTFYIINFGYSGSDYGFYSTVAGIVRMYNTLIDSSESYASPFGIPATTSMQYFGDYNKFISPNVVQSFVNGTVYSPLSAWQAAVAPQDANSVNTSPTPNAQTIACTLHQLNFTGPSSGNVNASSTNFTIAPNVSYNSVGQPIGYVGTVTVTPSGTAAAGLTPITLTFPLSASTTAQTFSIAPTATGTITLSEFANGATTSPTFLASTTLQYQSNITTPSAPYGKPVATAGNTTATVSFSAPASIGGSPVTSYTITSSPDNISTTTTVTSGVVTGLSNGTPYTFTVTATNAAGTGPASSLSNQVTPIGLPGAPTISSVTAGNAQAAVTFSAAASNGSPITGYIVASIPSDGTDSNASSTALTHIVTGLVNGTPYTFTVTATNAVGTGNASIASSPAVTPSTVASVSTNATSLVASTTATLNGIVLSTGGSNATQSGFVYGTDPTLTAVLAATSTLGTPGSTQFSQSLTSLTPNTTYYDRAYATNGNGTTFGSIVSFLTLPLAPAVSTVSVTVGSATTLTANGDITSTDGVNATVRGVVYGTSLSYGSTVTENGSFGTGAFTEPITGLVCNTTYHVAAFASNTGGTSYGTDATTTSAACPVAPTPTPTTSSSGGGSVSSSGGSVSLSVLTSLLAPSASTTAYLNSLAASAVPSASPARLNTPVAPQITSPTFTFTRDLKTGSTGADVRALEVYLNTHGYILAATGPGSPGNETNYFGPLTKKALMKFQKNHDISPVAGYFGPITRAAVNG